MQMTAVYAIGILCKQGLRNRRATKCTV